MMVEAPVIIIGGGVAGLAVAKILTDSGLSCTVVERDLSIGGHVRNWACMATDRCQRCFCCLVEDLVQEVSSSQKINILTGWELSRILPSEGTEKRVSLKEISSGAEVNTDSSAVVFATGFEVYNPAERLLWGHGRFDGVYTLAEVDDLLRQDMLPKFTRGINGLKVAFLQCVGSRDAASGANYCSQYCCKAALRMALKLVHECPDIEVTIFYIDLQVAGKYSGELLKNVEEKGVHLRQGVPGEIIQSSENMLEFAVEHQGVNVRERFDRIILSVGQRPFRPMSVLAGQLGIRVNEFGFLETNGFLDNSRMAVPGMYVAGTCSGPKDIEQTLEHAGQTAATIIADLQGGRLR